MKKQESKKRKKGAKRKDARPARARYHGSRRWITNKCRRMARTFAAQPSNVQLKEAFHRYLMGPALLQPDTIKFRKLVQGD